MTREGCKFNRTAEAYLCAAWCFDDDNDPISSKLCRLECISFLQLSVNAELRLQFIGKNINLILIDLYRRTEQFDKANELIDCLLYTEEYSKNINDIKTLLEYQKELIRSKDINQHTINDVELWKGKAIPNAITSSKNSKDDERKINININTSSEMEIDYEELYFDAMTDGQNGEYDENKTYYFGD